MRIEKFKLHDKDHSCYFFFAPCIYYIDREHISFGLEIFGHRFFYTDVRWK